MTKVGVLVVAYNAESTLSDVLGRIPDATVQRIDEIFVFDDFSTDRTYDVGLGYRGTATAAKVVMRRNPRNLMYGGNQKAGYRYAIANGFDIVVLLHGDGQYAPEVMDRLLLPLETGEADMVMGSRMLERGAALRGRMPLYKFVGNKVLTFVQNRLLGETLSEYHSGYRAYSISALRTIDLDGLTDGWHFDTQIILEFLRRDYAICEVPIPTYYGDEISRVNGVPYALYCMWETANFAVKRKLRTRRDIRTPPRPAK